MFEDYLYDALEAVSAWDDLPEDQFADAVNKQAKLMAGLPQEYTIQEPLPSPYCALQF